MVSQLASRLKRQLELARQREVETRNLYAFMRRLAGAFAVSDIHAAIQEHLATVTQHNVVLFASARDAINAANGRVADVAVPQPVLAKVVDVATAPAPPLRRNGDHRQRRGLAGARRSPPRPPSSA